MCLYSSGIFTTTRVTDDVNENTLLGKKSLNSKAVHIFLTRTILLDHRNTVEERIKLSLVNNSEDLDVISELVRLEHVAKDQGKADDLFAYIG